MYLIVTNVPNGFNKARKVFGPNLKTLVLILIHSVKMLKLFFNSLILFSVGQKTTSSLTSLHSDNLHIWLVTDIEHILILM